ncbi:brain-enriched guanylate kinase-associated protein-like [Scyliorhinus torazame]|uniref:brain-enriched guanylate kinase-associated protein-like n=1 Tax=Scyliorhinus torazame TaxID=75743 RepID=UPI003B5BC4CE
MNTRSVSDPEKLNLKSSSQKQNQQLQKHHLELQESESDTTRLYLETELQHAQEELRKLTEKLHRTQTHHTVLQQVNQDSSLKICLSKVKYTTSLPKLLSVMVVPLEDPTAQLQEEEKRNLSHDIITLCNQLTEAKITMDKLAENNVNVHKPAQLQGLPFPKG